MRALVGAVVLFSGLPLAVSTFAGTQPYAVIALHDQPIERKGCPLGPSGADPNTAGRPCGRYLVDRRPTFSPRNVYLVVARAAVEPGIAGVSCGIDASSLIGVLDWTLWADLESPSGGWPGTGGGNRMAWFPGPDCQRTVIEDFGVHAIAGAFYVYAYGNGRISVIPNPRTGIPEFKVADCSGSETDVLAAPGGSVGFGEELGYNPCRYHDIGACTCEEIVGEIDRTCCCDDRGGHFYDACNDDFCCGTVITGPCSMPCSVICATVATEYSSWGTLKSRY